MKLTKRRAVSVDEVMAKLGALARRYQIAGQAYDESASELMSEFDALKWVSLCAQRDALHQRETARRGHEIPSQFLGIYGTTVYSPTVSLENTYDGLNKLAA
jgi:hypothetical protein